MIHLSKDNKNTEDDIKKVFNIFKEEVLKGHNSLKEHEAVDLEKNYTINWACIWNKPKHIGKIISIEAHDSEFAIVNIKGIESTTENLLSRIYRIEDLTEITLQ